MQPLVLVKRPTRYELAGALGYIMQGRLPAAVRILPYAEKFRKSPCTTPGTILGNLTKRHNYGNYLRCASPVWNSYIDSIEYLFWHADCMDRVSNPTTEG